jgi:hypothetical protein
MEWVLENEYLSMNEKNKKLFAGGEFADKVVDPNQDIINENVDTFKMYSDFMKEKQALIDVINEIHHFCSFICGREDGKILTKILKIHDLINYRNRITMILDDYQEQPGLLDSLLPVIIPILMNSSFMLIEELLLEKDQKCEEKMNCLNCLYQIVYVFAKIRGYSTIIKFFSSEVFVFEPVITYLLSLDPEDAENSTLIYVLILWTSILGLIPFDIETIDSKGAMITHLTNYYKKTITLSGHIRDISAFALSKFLTRPDIIKLGLLDDFISFGIDSLIDEKKNMNIFLDVGILASLCKIFEHGAQKELQSKIDIIINNIINFEFPIYMKNSGLIRKYIAKLTQRVGLVMLKPKFQKWRYKIQLKTLMNNLVKKDNEEMIQEIDKGDVDDSDELNYEIDFQALESIIDHLMKALSDKDSIVRWSAAKGVGRICERLTKPMVEDIFHNLYSLFDDEDNEFAWQGACLCIAELCKRGMCLPEKIVELIPYLERALIFEVNKGTFCSGYAVRDAACYVTWALARAYTSEIMKPYVERLAKTLILTILFDKEVNCRRAASAAFQEHVGRQGYFPHGIEIITEADYFTLGNRINCYLNISTFISQYEEYYQPIIDYLAFNRLFHAEQIIRQLAAETLALLVPFKPQYFTDHVLPKLINYCFSPTLYIRHGTILGIGYILVGLSGKWDFENKSRRIRKKVLEGMNLSEKKILEDSDYRKSFEALYDKIKYQNNLKPLNKDLINEIHSMAENLDKKKQYRGKGSEIMRSAVNNLIRLVSEAGLEIEPKQFLYYLDILIDNLKHPNFEIQIEACDAFKLLNNAYFFLNEKEQVKIEVEKKFLEIIKQSVIDESIYVTKGFTLAIPFFHKELILKHYPEVLDALYTNCKNKKTNNNDAETRRYALESLLQLCLKLITDYVR